MEDIIWINIKYINVQICLTNNVNNFHQYISSMTLFVDTIVNIVIMISFQIGLNKVM